MNALTSTEPEQRLGAIWHSPRLAGDGEHIMGEFRPDNHFVPLEDR